MLRGVRSRRERAPSRDSGTSMSRVQTPVDGSWVTIASGEVGATSAQPVTVIVSLAPFMTRRTPVDVSVTSMRASPAVTNLVTSPMIARPEPRTGASTRKVQSSRLSDTGIEASWGTTVAVLLRQSHATRSGWTRTVPGVLASGDNDSSRISPEIGSSPGLACIATTYVQRPAGCSDLHSATSRVEVNAGLDSNDSSTAAIAV